MKSRPAPPNRTDSVDGYPVRVKAHDGYIECPSSVLAGMSGTTSGKPNSRLHLKFEIGGDLLGKSVAVNYGLPSPDAPELNGILIGKREPSRVLIVSFRSMDLRPEDAEASPDEWERAFGGLMARVRWDPSLAGLKPVGWFRSHPKSPLSLSPRDLELFNRFFPEPWQVGVALRPGSVTTTGRFFLREPGGLIRPESSFQDFVVRRNSDRSQVYVESRDRPAARDAAYLNGFDEPPRRMAAIWPATVILIAAVSGVGAWWILRPPQAPRVSSVLNQPVTPDPGQDATQRAETLWKQWEAEAKAQQLQGAAAAAPNLDLPPPPERSTSDDIRKSEAERAADLALDAKRRELKPEVRQNQREVTPETKQPANNRSASEPSTPASSQAPVTTPPLAPARRAENLPSPPPPQPTSVASNLTTNEHPGNEPSVRPRETPPSASASTVARDAASALVPPSASPATAPAVPPVSSPQKPAVAAAVHTGPASGRLIWTGRLRKNELLILDGDKPSTGSSSGSLPGQPITFSVSPGDLTRDGLVVYTALQPRPGTTQEPPGPQNGWNKTTYDWDPDRAADLEVMEAPGPNNGWKRLVLRSRKTRNAVVMVEWKRQS